jgi:hypothetical protein
MSDTWILVVFYRDDEDHISDRHQEDFDTQGDCETRIREIMLHGLDRDVTDENERQRQIDRELGRVRADPSDAPSLNPSFEWYPPHRIIKFYYFRSWDMPKEEE